MKTIVLLLVSASWLCSLSHALPATRRNTASGNWSNAATWGGTGPLISDNVIITSGTIVNLNVATVNSLGSLAIEPGAQLRLTVNGSSLHLSGDIINNGDLTLWSGDALKATLFLHAASYLSGTGTWNLGAVNLGTASLDFADSLVIGIADNISGSPGARLNAVFRRSHTVIYLNGTENSSLPANASSYFYPALVVAKTGAFTRTVSFTDQAPGNRIRPGGRLTLERATDRLSIGAGNTLELREQVNGSGTLSGGQTSNLHVRLSGGTDSILFTPGTAFSTLQVSGHGTFSAVNSVIVRDTLRIDSLCRFRLPGSATLSLGVNGSDPAAGHLAAKGNLVAGAASSLTVRGNGTAAVLLSFDQRVKEDYTLHNLLLSRAPGAGKVRLPARTGLAISGGLEIDSANFLQLNDGRLWLNLTATFRPGGGLTGSDESQLYLQGSGGNATLRFEAAGVRSNRTLKTLYLERTPGRIITLADTLFIRSELNLISGKLDSQGKLVFLSDSGGSAALNPLPLAADLLGEVVVQAWISGGAGRRGTRMLSCPVDDSSSQPIFHQLQNSVLITGTGGAVNGFDPGGQQNPTTATIQFYTEPAAESASFTQLSTIHQRYTLSPGTGKGFFLFYRGNRSRPWQKLNPENGGYAIPEPGTISYRGPVNKRDVPVQLDYTNNAGDDYNGYNAVGNPYPAPIDWTKVGKTNVADLVSIIKPGGGMVTYSDGLTINGSGLPLIQAGQGFYVRATAPGAQLRFTESCKAIVQAPPRFLTAPTARPLSTRSNVQRELLLVEISSAAGSEETAVVFEPHPADGASRDAAYFMNHQPGIFSRNVNGQALAIQFRALPEDSVVIALGCVPTGGSMQLCFRELPGSADFETCWVDRKSGTRIIVRKNVLYPVSGGYERSPLDNDARHWLVVKRKRATSGIPVQRADHLQLFPLPVIDTLHVRFKTARDLPVKIYDLSGLLIFEGAGNADLSQLAAGVYIAEVLLPGGIPARRRIIKR